MGLGRQNSIGLGILSVLPSREESYPLIFVESATSIARAEGFWLTSIARRRLSFKRTRHLQNISSRKLEATVPEMEIVLKKERQNERSLRF